MTRLLVVDDEAEICNFLKSFFEDRDFEVQTALSGEKAMELVSTFRPQVILLDIKMGNVDGLNVLQQVKSKNPKIKVIMVTALETTDKIEQAMRLGADNYITKPLSLEYLEKDVQEKIANLAARS
ncbi:MAG: response regulator [Candidatus Omnitrophica bacterium]|nr:response regulator [Candidatus Omnitrophota bacterium]